VDEPRRSLLDALGDAIAVLDPAFAVVEWNGAMERLTGVSRAKAVRRGAHADLPLLRDPEVVRRLSAALAGQASETVEVLHAVPADGRTVWLEVRCAPWRGAPGGVVGAVVSFSDVTERRRRALLRGAMEAIGHSLASSLDLNEVLDTIVGKALDVMGAASALVVAWDGVAPAFTVLRAGGRLAGAYAAGSTVPAGRGPMAWAVHEGRPVTTRNVLTDTAISLPPARRAQIEGEGYRAAAAAPLTAKGQVHGALVVHYWEERTVGEEELAALGLLAEQASLAIQNAQLYGEAQRRREVAEVLARLGRELTATLEVERLAEVLASRIAELVVIRSAAVFRREIEDGTLRAVATSGGDAEAVRGLVLQPGEGVAGLALAERRIVESPDLLNDPRVALPPDVRGRLARSTVRSAVGVPLVGHEHEIGALALGLEAGGRLSQEELQALQALADQAALAFENARLFESARESLVRLRGMQAQLVNAAKMSALGQLVAGVAHELNNPLAVIIGYGQLLLGREIPPPIQRQIELMASQAERMAKIVRNLLFFAQQRAPERVAVGMNEIIERSLGLRLNHLTLSGIEVTRDYAPSLPLIAGDPHQLEQVFLNLLLNAEQSILEGRRGRRITLGTSVAEAGRAVEARVTDDGPGIPAEALPHVFEPFFTTKAVGSGTGLGLSVSYGIVQEHGGRLSVASRPGETIFTLTLPVLRPDGLVSEPPAAALEAVRGDGRLALVVEDEPNVRDLMVTLLGQTGWRVDIADGGYAGLERVKRRRYELIVSDLRMVEGGGEEFFRRAVAQDPALQQRFVFITGDTVNRDAWLFFRDAHVPVIEKPFQPALFLDVVRRVTTSLTPSPPGE